jgi:hypothetical protein
LFFLQVGQTGSTFRGIAILQAAIF